MNFFKTNFDKTVEKLLVNFLSKIRYGKFIYPNFKRILDKIFSSESIRNYIYSSLFTKPKNYQISLIDNQKAIYKKRVFILEKKIMKECFVQDIGNFEVIYSVRKFFKDKTLIDV